MKRILALLFVLVFLGSVALSALPGSAATETWRTVNYLSVGQTYAFVHSTSINDNVSSIAQCVLKSVQSADPHGLAYGSLPTAPYPSDCLWTVESVSGGMALKSVATGKYLNLRPAGASDGDGKGYATMQSSPQALNLTVSAGRLKISAVLDGTTYYVRFTNTYRNTTGVSCWEAATPDGSNQFLIYSKAGTEAEYKNTEQPLFRVAATADLHIDYGIQSWAVPIRKSTITSAEFVRDELGPVDVFLLGGDILSRNDTKALWSKNLVKRAMDTVYSTVSKATKDGKVLMVTGNHDVEPSHYTGSDYNSSDYSSYMTENIGDFGASLYFNDMGIGKSTYNELLCYRYTISGVDFIGINTPYRASRNGGYIYGAQIDWVEKQLKAIGKDKTVIILCHYPAPDVSTPSSDSTGNARTKLATLLGQYPNVIYSYGHVHGSDNQYAWYSTSELVVANGALTPRADNAFVTEGYIHAHMGSMGYYNNQFNNYKALTADEPGINQLLMMEFYSDHITFKYYNTGEKTAVSGVREISSFTVVRSGLASQIEVPKDNESTSTNTSTNTSSSVSSIPVGTTDSGTTSDRDPVDDSGNGTEDDAPFVPPSVDTDVNATVTEENFWNANLGGTADELKNAFLEDYELEWAADGDSVSIYLETFDGETALTSDQKQTLLGIPDRGEVGGFVALDLYTQMEGEDPVKLTSAKNKVTVFLTLPEALRNTDASVQRTYTVLQSAGGEASVLPAQYDPATGMLVFETDNFTYCAVAYADTKIESSDTGSEGVDSDIPSGSDSSRPAVSGGTVADEKDGGNSLLLPLLIGVGAVVLSAGGFCVGFFLFRKKASAPGENP